MTTQRTFVLVHGAGHGGWCWRDVITQLRGRGHHVTALTLIGPGERAHVLDETVDPATHINDIANHLVGHSYVGAVITGVADRLDGAARRDLHDTAQAGSRGG